MGYYFNKIKKSKYMCKHIYGFAYIYTEILWKDIKHTAYVVGGFREGNRWPGKRREEDTTLYSCRHFHFGLSTQK